jgi:hypothetical protein
MVPAWCACDDGRCVSVSVVSGGNVETEDVALGTRMMDRALAMAGVEWCWCS